MNGRKILGVLLIVGLARTVFANHRHQMGPRGTEKWHDRIEEYHRELHRGDANLTTDVETNTVSV